MYAAAPGAPGAPAPQTLVYGMAIDDPAVAAKIKWVSQLAAGTLLFGVLYNFGQVINGVGTTALGALIFIWMVPACGYFGAKNKDRNLLCCFCGCSGCTFVTSCLTFCFVVYLLHVSTKQSLELSGGKNRCCEQLIDKNSWGSATDLSIATCDGGTAGGDPMTMQPFYSSKCQAIDFIQTAAHGDPIKDNCLLLPDHAGGILCCMQKDSCSTQLSFSKPFIGDGGSFIYALCFALLVQSVLAALSCFKGCQLWQDPWLKGSQQAVVYQSAPVQPVQTMAGGYQPPAV